MALRILIVTPWGERLGGAEEMLWLALRHLDRSRVEPSVAFLGPGPFAAEVAGLGLGAEVIPAGRLRDPRAFGATVRRLANLLRAHRPDLALAWSAKAQLYLAPAAALAGMRERVLWWQHQIPDGHWLDRMATRLPARAVGCSSEANRAAQEALRPRRPTFVVNPGIELGDDGAGSSNGGSGLRASLGIPPGRTVIGLVGRLQPWKGQDRFLGALAELRRRGNDVHGLLVGGEAYERSAGYGDELRALSERLGLGDRVTMTGQVDDPRPYFELIDVAVNASEAEPFGIVLLEAMAAGTPVVAVAAGGPLDVVEPRVSGVLAADGSPPALAAAIAALLADPGRRRAIAAAGRRRCEEHFSAAAMAAALEAELEAVARG
jgi:glycosyltransferase involved in cell wall biosynthesis